jgi:hypothetical protein
MGGAAGLGKMGSAAYMSGFADGTADHIRWMARGGIHAYALSYPQVPIQVFFVLLSRSIR